jgi:Family of unknown function (DUF6410)
MCQPIRVRAFEKGEKLARTQTRRLSLLLEHVRAQGKIAARIQDALVPLTIRCMGNCHWNRATKQTVLKTGFEIWIRTGIFWAPMMFIPLLLLISRGWGFGVLLYLSVALIVGGLTSYGGCEMVALPSFLFRRHYTIYCPLNAIDLVERRYTKR